MNDGSVHNNNSVFSTILELVDFQAVRKSDAPAVMGIDRPFLSYTSLRRHMSYMLDALNGGGIGRGDRVAVVLPNGPEMAVAFLGIAACATCAPLNPAYQEAEFEFYLTDLNARALLTLKNVPTPAREVAQGLGVNLIEIEPLEGAAGLFSMSAQRMGRALCKGWADSEDVAFILHTSGTTSRPKMVPLTQSNLCHSARNVAASLNLGSKDRCLNVMPLFHIHGLVAALLATLASGGAVVCTTGLSRYTYLFALSPRKIWVLLRRLLARFWKTGGDALSSNDEPFANERHRRMSDAHHIAMANYYAEAYPGKVVLLRNTDLDRHKCRMEHYFGGPEMCWRHLALGGVELCWLPGTHRTMFYRENAAILAAYVRECMERAILEHEAESRAGGPVDAGIDVLSRTRPPTCDMPKYRAAEECVH
jgi:acyl-CoA synthetase (AMP-forming)/AMP-acid ligase II